MSDAAGLVTLIGRLVFAYYFGVVAGIGHLKKDPMMRGTLGRLGSRSRRSRGGLPDCGSSWAPRPWASGSGRISDP